MRRHEHKSANGCCICRCKSSTSRFAKSAVWEKYFEECFLLKDNDRKGDICNACVLVVKRFCKQKKNRVFDYVVDSRCGPGSKSMIKIKKQRALQQQQQLLQQQQQQILDSNFSNNTQDSNVVIKNSKSSSTNNHNNAVNINSNNATNIDSSSSGYSNGYLSNLTSSSSGTSSSGSCSSSSSGSSSRSSKGSMGCSSRYDRKMNEYYTKTCKFPYKPIINLRLHIKKIIRRKQCKKNIVRRSYRSFRARINSKSKKIHRSIKFNKNFNYSRDSKNNHSSCSSNCSSCRKDDHSSSQDSSMADDSSCNLVITNDEDLNLWWRLIMRDAIVVARNINDFKMYKVCCGAVMFSGRTGEFLVLHGQYRQCAFHQKLFRSKSAAAAVASTTAAAVATTLQPLFREVSTSLALLSLSVAPSPSPQLPSAVAAPTSNDFLTPSSSSSSPSHATTTTNDDGVVVNEEDDEEGEGDDSENASSWMVRGGYRAWVSALLKMPRLPLPQCV